MKKDIHIIGSGFSALAAACYLAKAGHEITVFEDN
jgi:phytoene desaturase